MKQPRSFPNKSCFPNTVDTPQCSQTSAFKEFGLGEGHKKIKKFTIARTLNQRILSSVPLKSAIPAMAFRYHVPYVKRRHIIERQLHLLYHSSPLELFRSPILITEASYQTERTLFHASSGSTACLASNLISFLCGLLHLCLPFQAFRCFCSSRQYFLERSPASSEDILGRLKTITRSSVSTSSFTNWFMRLLVKHGFMSAVCPILAVYRSVSTE